jgi:hypothetical protein
LALACLVLLAQALLYVPHLLRKLAELLAQYPHPPLIVCVLVYVLALLLHLPLLLRVYAVHSWARLPLALLLLLQLLLVCVPALLVSYLLLLKPR